MGQTLSSDAESGSDTRMQTTKIDRKQLEAAFVKQATSLFSPIELFSFKNKLKLEELIGTHQISRITLFRLLDLPLDLPASDQIFRCLKFISLFPNFQSHIGDTDSDSIQVYGLVKVLTILDKDKYSKLFAGHQRILYSILFLSLTSANIQLADTEKFHDDSKMDKDVHLSGYENKQQDNLVDCVKVNNKIQWSLLPIVQSCDEYEILRYTVIASELCSFITFLMAISDIATGNKFCSPLTSYSDNFQNWDKYAKTAMNLVRSFDTRITAENITTVKISFTLFEKIIDSTMPLLFNPIHYFLQSLLYSPLPISQVSAREDHDEPSKKSAYVFRETRILTNQMLSQLSTFLPSELVFSRLRKLYTGAEAGFSMRSMESKIFKWNAPSILLVSGKRVDESKANKRYDTFKDTFPKFHRTSEIDSSDDGGNPNKQASYKNDNDDHSFITYGVYIKQPWKISNTAAFGDSTFEIFQLSPRQQIFKGVSTSSTNNNYCYFSTNGGGIGFGSPPPKIKSNGDKIYYPGAVSLTIDQTIEFAVFRNLGIGGYYKSQSLSSDDVVMEYEDRFQITDLEVWGCGTEKELEEQQKRWEWENREAKARQQLNVKDGRALLEMAGIVGNHNASGGSV